MLSALKYPLTMVCSLLPTYHIYWTVSLLFLDVGVASYSFEGSLVEFCM